MLMGNLRGLVLSVVVGLVPSQTAFADSRADRPQVSEVGTDAEVTPSQRAVAEAEAAVAKAEGALQTARVRMLAAIAKVRKKDALRKGRKPLLRPPATTGIPDKGRSGRMTEGEQLEELLMNDMVSTPEIDRLRAAARAAEEQLTAAQLRLETAQAASAATQTARRDAEWADLLTRLPHARADAVAALEGFQRRYPGFEGPRNSLIELRAIPSQAELKGAIRAAVVTPTVDPAATARSSAERRAIIEQHRTAMAKDPLILDKVERLLEIASLEEAEGHLGAATREYKVVLKEFPNAPQIPEAMFRLSMVLNADNRRKEAASYAMRLTKAYPRSPHAFDAYLVVAEYYLSQDMLPAALTNIEHALAVAEPRAAVQRQRVLLCRALLTWASAGRSATVAADLRMVAEVLRDATGAEAEALRSHATEFLKRLDGLPLE